MGHSDDSRLRILFLAGWYPTEDNPVFGIFVREHAKAVALYNDVVVLHPIGEPLLKRRYKLSDTVEEGIRTLRVHYCHSPIPKTTYFIYLWSVTRAFHYLVKEGFKPDVIHAHIFHAGAPAVILGRLYKIPVVITEQSTGFPRRILSKTEVLEARFAMNRAQLILPVSDDLWKHIEAYGIQNKFQIVPNVVNMDLFHPEFSSRSRETKRILVVALLTPKKGVPYLLQALSQLEKKRDDFILDIVGDGPYRGEYEKQAWDLGIADKVKFHGLKPKEIVAKYMRQCDFLVLPSLVETFGAVIVEALAAGKPVIVTEIGGPKEIVTSQVGILVPPQDAQTLAGAIDYMLDHHRDYNPHKITQYAQKRYSYEAVGKALDSIYRSLQP